MNDTFPTFPAFLAARGAAVADGRVRDFGDPAGELAAAASGSVVAPLGQFGILAFRGPDARAFLHGQLSCDVEGLVPDSATYGAYCTPKGRVLANFLLWREPDGFSMLLPRGILPGMQARLARYVLRSKVAIAAPVDEPVIVGVAGPAAADAAADAVGAPPSAPFSVVRREGVAVVALPEGRFVIAVPGRAAPAVWDRLASVLRPVGAQCWDWLDIASGWPWIGDATQDEFVPQMANLELLGGVSFHKGCYPGQEIVARTQHRGEVKRRLYLGHVATDVAPTPSQPLYSAERGDQAAGTVVNAAPAPGGGFDILAVVQTASAARDRVRLGSAAGAEVRFRELPYPVT